MEDIKELIKKAKREEKKNLEIGLWLYNIDKLRSDLRKQEDNIAVASGHYSGVEKELAEINEMIEQSLHSAEFAILS